MPFGIEDLVGMECSKCELAVTIWRKVKERGDLKRDNEANRGHRRGKGAFYAACGNWVPRDYSSGCGFFN